MWQCAYAKEPFDLRLFVLQSGRRWKWLLLGTILGMLLIGGGYYLKNVSFGGQIPYRVVNKFYVEYAVDPATEDRYTYFAAYTWDDWLKSDRLVPQMLEKLSVSMSAEEFITYYNATLPADLRIPYITVLHPDKELAAEISTILAETMLSFGEAQQQIESVEWIDMVGPAAEAGDIRTARAVILGAVAGFAAALFVLGFMRIVDDRIYVPETFEYRYDIPMLGYVDTDGAVSAEVSGNLTRFFGEMHEIGEISAAQAEALADAAQTLRAMDGNLLVIKAGELCGKNIEFLLNQCKKLDIQITAAILTDADGELVKQYRFGRTDT